jgi:hypothetical protein
MAGPSARGVARLSGTVPFSRCGRDRGAAGSGVSDLKKTRGEIQKALFVVCRVRVARVSRAVRRDGRSRRGTRTAHRRFPCSPRPRKRPRGRGTASKTSRRSSRASRAPTAGRDIARRAGSSVRLRWRIGTPRKTAWGWWTPHPDGRGTSPQSTARASRPRGEWRGRRARASASRVLRQAHATFRKLRGVVLKTGPDPARREPATRRSCTFRFRLVKNQQPLPSQGTIRAPSRSVLHLPCPQLSLLSPSG